MDNYGFAADAPHVEAATLRGAIDLLPSDQKWMSQHLYLPDNGEAIAAAIQSHKAIAVSDGSLKLNVGTAAFIITTLDNSNPIIGSHVVPGKVEDGDSLRCELSGLYGILSIISVITQRFSISQGLVHVACDNKQALTVFHPDFLPNPQYANFDLFQAIWSMVVQSPLTWTSEHVKGHQDSKKRHQPLTPLERLNVKMDRLAKSTWLHSFRQASVPPDIAHISIRGEGWQLWNGSVKVINPSTSNLYDLIQDSPTQMWWIRHGIIERDTCDLIDWEGTQALMNHLTPAERRYVTKTASANCGVGATLVQWKFQADAHCPRCGQYEDGAHVYRCRGQSADEVWTANLTKLRQYFHRTDTHPEVGDALVTAVSHWRGGLAIDLRQFSPSVQSALRQQHQIGWKNLLEGLAGTQWRQLQDQHLSASHLRASSRKWLRGTLTHLLRLGRGQWLHRNDEKHRILRPRHKRADLLLRRAIIWLYSRRTLDLLPGDHQQVNVNLCELLQRSVHFRQSWYMNLVAARNRCLRIRHGIQDLEDPPPHHQDIMLWISGRPC